MIRAVAALSLILVAACGGAPASGEEGDVGTSSANDAVMTYYNKLFSFTSPPKCSLYMVDRVVVTPTSATGNYVGEYDEKLTANDPDEFSTVFTIAPSDPLPVQVALSMGSSHAFAQFKLSQSEVTVSDSANHVLLTVGSYQSDSPTVTTSAVTPGAPVALPALASLVKAIEIFACLPPVHPELGSIPGFFANRRDISVAAGDAGSVTAHDDDTPAAVSSWAGKNADGSVAMTILEAYERVAVCVKATGRSSEPFQWTCGSNLRPEVRIVRGANNL